MKKIIKISIIILSIILLKLFFTFITNEIIIYRYNKDQYSNFLITLLKITNMNEPYIIYYNEGNTFFTKEKYDEAISDYEKAIAKRPPLKRRCDIRINMALALTKNINTDNKEEIIKKLEEARSLLYIDNCANKSDNNGKSKESEELEEAINETIESVKKDSPSNGNKEKEEEEPTEEEENNIEEELKKIHKDSNKSRQEDLQTYENLEDYQYYSGKNW